MINKKIKWTIVILLVLVILFFLFQKVILIKPRGRVTDISPNFVWFGNYEEYNLLVAEDKSFENPLIDVVVNGNSFESEELDFGEYYWKIVYSKNNETFEVSPVRFIVNSFVAFSFTGNFIRNIGNVDSNLIGPTGLVVLEKNQEIELEKGDYKLEQR